MDGKSGVKRVILQSQGRPRKKDERLEKKMAATWFVTLSALLRYAAEALQAQDTLNEAKEQMKSAASELCTKWVGDAANAFAREQGILDGWFGQLISIGSEYITAVKSAADKYQETEEELARKVNG